MRRWSMTAAVAALGVCLASVVGGCAAARDPGVQAAARAEGSPTAPPGLEASGSAPPYREYRLSGSFRVAAHTERTALLVRETNASYPINELWAMNLQDGRTEVVRRLPVNSGAQWHILGYKLSEGWVAWEEVSPGEETQPPSQVFWRLYVAPFDPAMLRAADATLAAEGVLDKRSRPLFGFDGDALVWMTNQISSGGAEGVVRRRELVGGSERVLARVPGGLTALAVSGSDVIVAPVARPGGDAHAVTVLDARSGSTKAVVSTGPAALSHFPTYHDGWLAWSEFASASDQETAVYLMAPRGTAKRLLVKRAGDPVLAGPYVFFETDSDAEGGGGAGRAGIAGQRLGDSRSFTLVECDRQGGGWWQTVLASGFHRRTFVIFNDLSAWTGKEETLVRVYDVSSS